MYTLLADVFIRERFIGIRQCLKCIINFCSVRHLIRAVLTRTQSSILLILGNALQNPIHGAWIISWDHMPGAIDPIDAKFVVLFVVSLQHIIYSDDFSLAFGISRRSRPLDFVHPFDGARSGHNQI